MRIVEVIPSFEPLGGAENFVFNLSLSFTHEVEIYVISLYHRENDFIAKQLYSHGVELIYLNKKKGIDFHTSSAFGKIIKRIQPDIVHIHLNSYLTCLPSMLFRKSIFIYTFHTLITEDTYGKRCRPSNYLMRYLIKHGFMFPVTISNVVDDSFKLFFGDYKRKIVYNGINTTKYAYSPQKPKKFTFISIGSFNVIKNNLFMIKCVERLITEGANINYVVLGEGENFQICKDYCLEHNLLPYISFPGRVNNVEAYLEMSSCLLLASHWEGNPLVINEAISSGVWVIANSVGGVKDLIDNTNGYLVIPENENDFVDKMRLFLINQNDIAKNIIPENIERNRDRVDIKNACSKYMALMRDLIERR